MSGPLAHVTGWHPIALLLFKKLKSSASPLLCPAALHHLQAKGQDALVDKLTKNVGTAIGLELRDTTQQLNTSNSKPVKAGMTFNVAVGEPRRKLVGCAVPCGRCQW